MSLVLYNTVYTEQVYVVPDWGSCTDAELATALQKHYAGEIDLHEHWKIEDGIVRPVTLTTGEQIELVLMHPGQYSIVGEKVDTPVGNLPVGTVIQLNEGGSPVDYIVVHQGNPDPDMYDESCDGTWVLRRDAYTQRTWDSSNNDYGSSEIHSYLNGTFLNLFDETTKSSIKQVKIPYQNGTGSGGSVASGANGLSCKIFMLSGYEVGFSTSDDPDFPRDGAKLSYFMLGNESDACDKRAILSLGRPASWWLRTPRTSDIDLVWRVGNGGGYDYWTCSGDDKIRAAFILDPTYTIKADPTCAFVLGMKNCLRAGGVMNSTYTNVGGWHGCEMRTWLNDTVYNQIPESFRQNLKLMNVWTANGGQTGIAGLRSQDYLALPAEREVFDSNTWAESIIESQLFQFKWYSTPSNRIKQISGRNEYWWGRSARSASSDSFCCVTYAGGQAMVSQ